MEPNRPQGDKTIESVAKSAPNGAKRPPKGAQRGAKRELKINQNAFEGLTVTRHRFWLPNGSQNHAFTSPFLILKFVKNGTRNLSDN